MTRIPVAMAGLALVAVTAVACGSDDGDDAPPRTTRRVVDPQHHGVTLGFRFGTDSPSTSDSPTDSDDPVPSPIINKAVKAAIADGFPAMVPAGVPAGWTVTKATYSPKGGGMWWIYLTDPNGADVTLAQSTKTADGIVKQYLPDAQPAGTVNLSNFGTGTWTAYTGTRAAAVAKDLSEHRCRGRRPRPEHGRDPRRGAAHRRGRRQRRRGLVAFPELAAGAVGVALDRGHRAAHRDVDLLVRAVGLALHPGAP